MYGKYLKSTVYTHNRFVHSLCCGPSSTEGSTGSFTRGEGHNEALDNLRCRQDCSGSYHKTEETYTRYLRIVCAK